MTRPSPELAAVTHLLAEEAERTRTGGGRLVLLRGATGTGRTTVLEAAADQAVTLGLKVLRARCSPGDTAISFATVLQILGPVPEFADIAVDGDERATAAGSGGYCAPTPRTRPCSSPWTMSTSPTPPRAAGSWSPPGT